MLYPDAILTPSGREAAVDHFHIRCPVGQVIADLEKTPLPGIGFDTSERERK